ncbi:hypothetical protein EDL99_04120 [Ornithobacterium rhinotracheale]|uniref:hypothetical protein n=1 Tax=Ornithobacterium rhinotracheale TaxID=28251 RepID=UPI00129CB97A|nr:hypothetical protein [Ornithobacterium rhinotracheale]MRJ08074.1 hypothetical protein [Ornithobacterium rhinotracheale]UOH78418.1 hypothetical protein MT996_02865 [Ornithobacterium rhinotracheale]
MTQRDKKRVKKGLFILLLVWLLFRLTKKTSIKEKITTGDGSLLPLDTNKFKEPVSLPKVDKPKFDSVFAKGGSAVRNEKAFAHKVEDMMNAERRKGKIPVKSDVVKQVQREQALDVSPAEPCVECEEEKRRRAQEEMAKQVTEKQKAKEPAPTNEPCNPLSFEPRAYENHCDGGMSLLAQKENVFVYINGPHKRVVNKNGKVARVDAGVNVHILQNNHYVDVDGDFSTYDGTYSINQNGIIE